MLDYRAEAAIEQCQDVILRHRKRFDPLDVHYGPLCVGIAGHVSAQIKHRSARSFLLVKEYIGNPGIDPTIFVA
ncbi:hypothetical protein [Rhizobium sp. 007]|uniref:hypothetical protein n=1 Tax=Rhizobium sp. 007 TaxID=2785056 RepID=UPI00188E039D|nr:hypothetical protein [Rhizobium sp. 007]QPB24371.1 hypothetical protein ISN39_33025 [Rhizobium sp. 007]